ncbi:hypothetical protein FHY18_000481 [Xanthomonas arboricola]|uniref:hypothetical protein n=1 Tax=Xanthomonas sp. 3793 TaxID=3035312 RepID=UPI0021694AF3|nr:hypothetical protein [Xanthomonas sp. 3793]MCS3744951.1 hypothetical protein [Xanthomonas sp. 3793]
MSKGDLHLIERMGHMTCLDKQTALWESGWWAISPETASLLVGGRIYFHKAQDKPSFFGGRIVESRVETEGSWPGRVLFKFIAGQEFKGVRAGRDGWSMEKKLVPSLIAP